jgi:hypothetical protein
VPLVITSKSRGITDSCCLHGAVRGHRETEVDAAENC